MLYSCVITRVAPRSWDTNRRWTRRTNKQIYDWQLEYSWYLHFVACQCSIHLFGSLWNVRSLTQIKFMCFIKRLLFSSVGDDWHCKCFIILHGFCLNKKKNYKKTPVWYTYVYAHHPHTHTSTHLHTVGLSDLVSAVKLHCYFLVKRICSEQRDSFTYSHWSRPNRRGIFSYWKNNMFQTKFVW